MPFAISMQIGMLEVKAIPNPWCHPLNRLFQNTKLKQTDDGSYVKLMFELNNRNFWRKKNKK